MVDFTPRDDLSPGANSLVEEALQTQAKHKHETLGWKHWLLVLLKRHGPMAESLVDGLDAKELAKLLRKEVGKADVGEALDAEKLVAQALERAAKQGKERASERDLAAVILQAAGYEVADTIYVSTAPGSESGGAGAEGVAFGGKARRPTPTIECSSSMNKMTPG